MIITRTPFRMSFFGGGTDMPEFFKEHGGAVLSTSFDKYCYVNVRHLPRFFDYSTELSYSKLERVTRIEDIEHPAVREAMKFLDMHELRLTYEADLPARSGLGTSSSFAVGMLNAFYALKGKYADKKRLADEAIYLERELCHEAGGWQDQIAASYGGLNVIRFDADGYRVSPVIVSAERKRALNENLMLFFTGFSRGDEPFLLTYGDGVSDVDLNALLAFHREKQRIATITMVNIGQAKGVLDVGDNGEIRSFREKDDSDGAVINGGFMVCEPGIFDYIAGDDTVLEQEPFRNLCRDRELVGYYHRGFWQCMDTQREKKKLEELWESGNAPWKRW